MEKNECVRLIVNRDIIKGVNIVAIIVLEKNNVRRNISVKKVGKIVVVNVLHVPKLQQRQNLLTSERSSRQATSDLN